MSWHIHSTSNGEATNTVKIDTSAIRDATRYNLAAATLNLIHGILQQPGGREALDAKIAAKKARAAVK